MVPACPVLTRPLLASLIAMVVYYVGVFGGASGGGSGFLGAIGAVAMTREVGRLSQPGRCDGLFVTAFP